MLSWGSTAFADIIDDNDDGTWSDMVEGFVVGVTLAVIPPTKYWNAVVSLLLSWYNWIWFKSLSASVPL